MKKKIDVYLDDIFNSILKIEQYTDGVNFETFCNDDKTQDAVIRNLAIIGEACNRLGDDFFSNNPDFPLREAVAMRNFLIHDYDSIDVDVIWKTLKQDIPELKNKVMVILSRSE